MPPAANLKLPPRQINLRADPARVLRAWPTNKPLAVLWSADPSGRAGTKWSRWSIFTQPVGALRTTLSLMGGLHTQWHGSHDPQPHLAERSDPLAAVTDALQTAQPPPPSDPDTPPFQGGWIGSLSYDLGQAIEPAAASPAAPEQFGTDWPHAILHRCPAAYVHDRATDRWWVVGEENAASALPSVESLGQVRETDDFELGVDDCSQCERTHYMDDVARIVEYIRAGDVFQANLAHTLSGPFRGLPRALFAAMVDAASPWYGAYIEDPCSSHGFTAALSISPELFLDFDPASRIVTTRPIKGTRTGAAEGGGAEALAASPKDAAELAMIVDLMRNDLGRVCDFGSIRVAEARAFEMHARNVGTGLVHGVATVQGRLRAGLNITDLLRATFPGGSITGAPKIRAMQIIHELEMHARGPYCGSIGYLSDCGRACFNIAIRTAHVSVNAPDAGGDGHGAWRFGTGAGIVADSDPASEWAETLAKAEVMTSLAREHPLGIAAAEISS